MRCSNCGNELPNGAMFCGSCGARAENQGGLPNKGGKRICAVCGAELEPDSEFCGNCGSRVEFYRAEELNYMFCGSCGARIPVNSRVCKSCGAGIYESVRERKVYPAANTGDSSALKIILIALLILVLAAGGVFAGYFILENKDKSDEDNTAAVTATIAATPASTTPPTATPVSATASPVPAATAPAMPPNNDPNMPPGQQGAANGDYLFNSDREYITEEYLNTQTQEQVRLILNEIYARHGYIFTLEQYKSYFSSKPWYKPKYTSAEEAEKYFNSIEMQNKATIVAYETAKGWR